VRHLRRAIVLGAAAAVCAVTAASAQTSLRAVWGSGPNDVWAVGGSGSALHFTGQAWTEVPYGMPLPGAATVVWGSAPNNVFVGGEGGVILQWDGRTWTRMTVPIDRDIVALSGRSATEVYALTQSYTDREAPTLLRWNGRAWTAAPLSMPFRANGVAVAGASVVVAGFAMNDPTPSERRTAGVLARRSAAGWLMAGWNGRAVTDRVIAGAGWTAVEAAGIVTLLTGERDDGERVLALSRGAAPFAALPAVPGARIGASFLGSDGVPVALLGESGLARWAGMRWVVVGPGAAGGVAGANAQAMAQAAAQDPMAFAATAAAWGDLGNTRAAWGSATDFHAVTESGRVIRVQASEARIVYDPACLNPQMAALNPVCRGLQPPTGASGQPPIRRPLPMPSIRTKPPVRP